MIRAHHTSAGALVAALCAGPWLGHTFREVRVRDQVRDDGRAILMLANHFSWWDGFIQYRLNRTLFRRRLYAMMLEEQLARHPFLARCGCFSVNKRGHSLIETLDYAAAVVRSPENMLLLFPQGALRSLHAEVPGFEPGAARILERIGGECQLLMNVNLPEWGAERKPRLDCYLEMHSGDEFTGDALRPAWERFYAACKQRQTAAL